jgi:replication factor A1
MGRPRSNRSGKTWNVIDLLARMAIRKNIDLDSFFNTLVEAWKHGESTFENLVIECRKKTEDSGIFLFTMDKKIIGQFSIPKSILNRKNPIKSYADNIPSEQKKHIKNLDAVHPKDYKVKDLEPRMKKIALKARVLEIPKPKMVNTRWGTSAMVSNVLIADESGSINLSLWNHQINRVSVNDVIKIENAKVVRYRGELQLRLGRNGELNVVEDGDFSSLEKLTD